MVDQKGRGGRNRKRARILANGTLKMFNNKHNLNGIPSANTEVQLIQQVANADYSGAPSSLPLPPPPPATGMEASSSQQPSPKRRRARKKKRLDEVGLFTQQRGEKPKHKVPPVNGVFPSTQQMPEKCTLELVLEKLQRIDIHEAFAQPIDSNEVKDYYKFIKNPMDFGTMRAKLHEGTYTTLEQFENDVFLICSNAMCFNTPTTSYYKQAHAIHNLAERLFNNLKNDLKAINMEYSLPRRRVRRSQVEGGCLGIKLCAKLSGFRDGQNVNLCETERRQTYKPLTSIFNEKSIFSMFHSSLKQLVLGNGGIKYKESLMQFVKHLGPTARKMANQKLKCLTQTPSHHFQGSNLQISSLATQQRPSCRERIIKAVTPYANNSLGIHDASSREKNILSRENIDINSNACRGRRVLGGGRLEIQDTISKGKNVIKGGSIDPYGGVNKGKNVVKGDGTNPYVGAYGRHTTLIGWANFQGDTTRIHSALQWARAGGTDKKVIDQTLNDMASIIGPSSGSILSSEKKDLLAQVLKENSYWQSESNKSWPGFEFPTFQNEGLNNTSANFKYMDLLQEAIREDFAHSSQNAPNNVFSYPPNYRTSNINDWPTEMIDSFRSQSRLVELLCGGNRHPKSSVYPSKVVNPSSDYKATLAQVTKPPLEWNQPTPWGPQAMYDFTDINPLGQDVFGKPNGVNPLDQDDQDVELQLALAQSMQPHKPHNVIVFGQEALSQLGLQIMPTPYVQPQPGLLNLLGQEAFVMQPELQLPMVSYMQPMTNAANLLDQDVYMQKQSQFGLSQFVQPQPTDANSSGRNLTQPAFPQQGLMSSIAGNFFQWQSHQSNSIAQFRNIQE